MESIVHKLREKRNKKKKFNSKKECLQSSNSSILRLITKGILQSFFSKLLFSFPFCLFPNCFYIPGSKALMIGLSVFWRCSGYFLVGAKKHRLFLKISEWRCNELFLRYSARLRGSLGQEIKL